jgi:NTE family protein
MEETEDLTEPTVQPPKKIKHLVIPGGGGTGFVSYGALRESHKQGKWNIADIETIYGTSIGAIFAVVLALKYDWSIIDDYLIKRPWNQVFKMDIYSIVDSFQKKGIFTIQVVEEMFKPLFNGLDIPMSVTLREFYDITKIEVHTFCVDLKKFEPVDMSYKTHPDWRLIDAVYASACLPILFAPFEKEGRKYLDGGFFLNYPIQPCIDNGADIEEILGIMQRPRVESEDLPENSTLFDYILMIFNNTIAFVLTHKTKYVSIPNEILIESSVISIYNIFHLISSSEERIRYIESGVEAFTSLLQSSKTAPETTH